MSNLCCTNINKNVWNVSIILQWNLSPSICPPSLSLSLSLSLSWTKKQTIFDKMVLLTNSNYLYIEYILIYFNFPCLTNMHLYITEHFSTTSFFKALLLCLNQLKFSVSKTPHCINNTWQCSQSHLSNIFPVYHVIQTSVCGVGNQC